EPNVELAKIFTGAGVESMAAPPTATTGEPSGPVIPATRWATPIATNAVIRPVATPRPHVQPRALPCRSAEDVTPSIRSRHRPGLLDRGCTKPKPARLRMTSAGVRTWA